MQQALNLQDQQDEQQETLEFLMSTPCPTCSGFACPEDPLTTRYVIDVLHLRFSNKRDNMDEFIDQSTRWLYAIGCPAVSVEHEPANPPKGVIIQMTARTGPPEQDHDRHQKQQIAIKDAPARNNSP